MTGPARSREHPPSHAQAARDGSSGLGDGPDPDTPPADSLPGPDGAEVAAASPAGESSGDDADPTYGGYVPV